MDKNEEIMSLNEEDLKNLTVEELVDLKIELNDMLQEVENLIEQCDEL